MPQPPDRYSNGIKRFIFLLLACISACHVCFSQNAIVTENLLPGNPISEWGVNSSADFRNVNLNGFATNISVNKGATVHFKIDGQNGVPFTIKIYRLGYYGGMGARFQADLGSFPGLKQAAPGINDPLTGLVDCSNWVESASWAVPTTAVSGFYVAKLESAGGINNIVFIVRDDASHSDIFFQANDATWQAYNAYGGSNVYNGTTNFPSGHAVKLSYNRPFFIYNTGFITNGNGSDWYMNDAYPMIRWMERNGYDISYTTNVDVARFGNLLLNHKIYVTAGHDEYWSKEQRTNVEAARSAGVHCAFFTGNEVYWKTRWETDVNGNANGIMVCYKEGLLADGTQGEATCGFKCDASAPTVWTGLWRTGQAYDAPLPENALTGQISWDGTDGVIDVPDTYKNLRFWRNTSVAVLGSGQTATLAPHTLGYEWDYDQFPNTYPHGRIKMSNTVLNGHTHNLSLYRYGGTGGPLVFGAGTVLWSWGLDVNHFGGTGNQVSKDMQQATVNLFADMGAQAGSLQSDLVAAAASTDVTAPVSVITSPVTGSTVTINTTVTINGTATDVGGAVGGIEVSVDGGTTWQVASGTNNWTFSWTPLNPGSYTIKSRAFDDSGNMEDASSNTKKNVIVITLVAPNCNACNIFTTQVPTASTGNDGQALELGVKFRSVTPGFITGIRFYKTTGNSGTHTGELYSSTGTRLAQATFTGETATGWQTVSFSTPVAITANTTYVAAYFSSAGNYVGTPNYFTTAVLNSPLTALADGTDGPNGLYLYTGAPAFPTNSPSNKKPNYWVDVVFSNSTAPTAYAGLNQTIVSPVSSVTLDGSGSTGMISSYSWTKVSGPNTPVITTPNAVSTTVTGLIQGTYIFQLSVNGGASTSQVTVNVVAAITGVTIFTTQTPLETTGNDGQPIELGVKFRSATAGFITGIRFYKTTGNSGTHTGELYSSTGSRLSQATFTGETATGWQTVTFSTPVAITANTTYVAAYFSSAGSYVGTPNYFTSGVLNSPLTALADGTDGPNGLYLYTGAPAFPTNSPSNKKPNYWVDVVFSTSTAPTANAGSNQTITLPVSSVTLDGSGSTGTISSYSWTKVSGPNTPVITTPNAGSTTVTGLIQGTYIFQLSVNGGASTSQVTVTVNAAPPPTANAGSNQTITLPVSSVTLNGSGSTGTISSYSWTKVSGPNTPVITTPNAVSTTVTGLIQGTYIFQLSVNGGVSTSQVTVTVNAAPPPTANAGSNQTITLPVSSVTLNGSGSTGTISSYSWTKVSGPNTPVITTPNAVSTTVTGLIQGTYIFQLSVNGGASTSQVTVSVVAAITGVTIFTTQTPLETTGNDGQPIELGVKFRSATAGFITGIRFYKTTGNSGTHTGELYSSTGSRLSQATFTGETATGWQTVTFSTPVAITANTTYVAAYFSSAGSYVGTPNYFTSGVLNSPLTALADGTDGPNGLYLYTGAPAFPTNSPSNKKPNYWVDVVFSTSTAPTANAGSNQTITLPVSSVTLNGSGSTGTISSYSWTKVSGPNTPVITTPNAGSTTVTGLIQGTYIFQLSVNGGASTSQVTVTVNAAPPPTANAGSNQTITLPASSVTLNGSGSTGTISSYSWTKVSGPNTPVITTPNAGSTTVTGLIQGTYIFQLSVNGGASTSQVTVSVVAAITGVTIFTTQTPLETTGNDGQPIELGVKFRSATPGFITGIRFYKTTGNSGTHTGELYSSTGSRLSQATFTGETATGWQTVTFSTPVAITANTTYVAAYFSSAGNYVGTPNYFTSGVLNSPLTALADGTDGPNGLYLYTGAPAFPTNSPSNKKPNYWVDVVYSSSTQTTGIVSSVIFGNLLNQDTASALKNKYFLAQNYPNPFYKDTRIDYGIQDRNRVILDLLDMQGRQIRTLVNGIKDAGVYYYILDTYSLPKGLYLYRMRAGHYQEVKKLIVQ